MDKLLNGTKEGMLIIPMLLIPAGVDLVNRGESFDGISLVVLGVAVIIARSWLKKKIYN